MLKNDRGMNLSGRQLGEQTVMHVKRDILALDIGNLYPAPDWAGSVGCPEFHSWGNLMVRATTRKVTWTSQAVPGRQLWL